MWANIWRYPPYRLCFLLRAVYNTLPSPANLGGISDIPDCILCGKPGTLEYVLSSCQITHASGRYTWMHYQVQREFADILEQERKHRSKRKSGVFIQLVKEGHKSKPRKSERDEILDQANDWAMAVELGIRLFLRDCDHNIMARHCFVVPKKKEGHSY